MGIDWFIFFAQIVNFLILMGLLWRFLYRPVMKAMSERERRIAHRLEEAEQKKREAEHETRTYREKVDDLEERREQLLAEAKQDAEQQKKQLVKQIREEVDEKKARWFESIEDEKEAFFRELHHRLEGQLVSALNRILGDLADETMETRVVEKFLRRLRETKEQEQLDEALQASDGPIEVATAFDLAHEHEEKIKSAVKSRLQKKGEVTFVRSEDLICGVELRTDGRKIGWSINSYLEDLEDDLAQVFHRETEQDDSN